MRNKLILAIIILLGFILRLYRLGQLPSILNRDEAALAYNGLLIAETGQDEWQRSYPLMFESFGDYKLPGYIYTLAGIFSLAQPNDFLVRLPAALAGTGLIMMAYLFAKKLKLSSFWAMLASLLTALTPIFIFYSRMAWEANLGLLLNLISFYLLFFGNKKSDKSQINVTDLAAVSLSLLASLTYNSPWLYLPFMIVAVIFQRGLKQYKKWLVPMIGLSLVFVFGLVNLSSLAAQKSGITIFTDETVWANYVVYRQSFPGLLKKIVGNRYLYWLILMGQNFIQSFSPVYLLTKGGQHPWHNLPGRSHLFYSGYILGLIGLGVSLFEISYNLIKQRELDLATEKKLLLIYTLVFSLFPAIITVDAPHATRSLLFFFVFTLFSIFGLKYLIKIVADYRQQLISLFFIIIAIETAFYFKQYFVDYPQQQSAYKPGFDIVIQSLEKKLSDQDIAIVSGPYQYILAAWYLKLPPQTYFKTNIRQEADKIGIKYGEQVGNYHFIADKQDRREAEKILVFWDNDSNQWQIERY